MVLADLDLERPVLHLAAGVANEEGVVDLLEFGISLGRLLRSAGGGSFDLLPAGLIFSPAGDLLRHERWDAVLIDIAMRRATLLAYVPAEADGVEAVIERAGAVIVLAERDEGRAVVEKLRHPYSVIAVLTPEPPKPPAPPPPPPPQQPVEEAPAVSEEPAGAEPVEVVEAEVAVETGTAAASEGTPEGDDVATVVEEVEPEPSPEVAPIQEVRERQRAARLAGAPVLPETGAAADEVEPEEAAEEAPEEPEEPESLALPEAPAPPRIAPVRTPVLPPRSRFSRPLAWTIGVVLLASLAAGAWHFLGGRLPFAREAAPPPEPVPEAAPPTAAMAAAEQDALPYVVALEAHRQLLAAAERVADLAEIEPEIGFHIEAVEREGALYYHVMAGPVADSAAALALRDTLIRRGHKTAATPTDIRLTPLAFLIGDYSSDTTAFEQRDILLRLDIPSYVVRATAVDGQPVYRLYVGGFSTPAQAAIMRELLRNAGIRDTLVARTGIAGATAAPAPNDSLVSPTGQ